MKSIAQFFLWLGGWKYVGELPKVDKAIIISVPHTSAWDYIWGELIFLSKKLPVSILIKKEFFFFPIGYLLKALHAIPVDRGNKENHIVKRMSDEFRSRSRMYLCITPEGSRKLRKKWKKGFLAIAREANVPVYLGWLDYRLKQCGVGELFYPTGDDEADMKYIMSKYCNVTAKHPEYFYCGECR